MPRKVRYPSAVLEGRVGYAIRRNVRAGLPQRAIHGKHEVSRATMLAAEASAWPTPSAAHILGTHWAGFQLVRGEYMITPMPTMQIRAPTMS